MAPVRLTSSTRHATPLPHTLSESAKTPAAGCAAIRQAWEAAVAGVELAAYAREHEALRLALEKFG